MKTSQLKTIYVVLSAIIGILTGLASHSGILEGRWENIVFWGIIGLLLGWIVPEKKLVLSCGIVYGVAMILSFLISGYQGSPDHLQGFIVLSVILTVISAFCGYVCTFIGFKLRRQKV